MKLEWMGEYRDIVGNFYRSANGYSQICKTELFGDKVKFSPYEVQIMENILEYAEDHKNMKWYADRLGLGQATYSKYVQKLVAKGLVDKYHAVGNKKNVILMLSPLGMEEYGKYVELIKARWFQELFDVLNAASPKELALIKKVFSVWGGWHVEDRTGREDAPAELLKLEG